MQRLFTAGQVAEILGLKERTIRAWIASGRLQALRVGVNVRVPADVIEGLLEQAQRAPLPAKQFRGSKPAVRGSAVPAPNGGGATVRRERDAALGPDDRRG